MQRMNILFFFDYNLENIVLFEWNKKYFASKSIFYINLKSGLTVQRA